MTARRLFAVVVAASAFVLTSGSVASAAPRAGSAAAVGHLSPLLWSLGVIGTTGLAVLLWASRPPRP